MKPQRELTLFRFLSRVEARLDHARDAHDALLAAVRMAREFFEASASCVAFLHPGGDTVRLEASHPRDSTWDAELIADFLAQRRPRPPRQLLLAAIERRERPWAAVALRRDEPEFNAESVQEIRRIAATVTRLVQRIDRMRVAEVRLRIDQKLMEQLRPKDLFYQILHGLRALTYYDHSAALLTYEPQVGALEVVAEQIRWRKDKSRRIGHTQALGERERATLESGLVQGYDRRGAAWVTWEGQPAGPLADVLDYNRQAGDGHDAEPEGSMLCAPLLTRERLLGVVKISSCHAGALGPYETALVQRLLPHAVVAIQNLNRAESLETAMLRAEKKHALANLARGVSHDVNNAMGSVLPLVQQMACDVRDGRIDPPVLARDLEQIETSLQVCRRIFGSMLSFARGEPRGLGEGDLRLAAESTLAVLEDSMRRHSVSLRLELPADLPRVRCAQTDLEQLLLNVTSNACEAMPAGGDLSIRAHDAGDEIELCIEDTGEGIPAEHLSRVLEPFFSTKPDGNGLGLSICRSIVWEHHGRLIIEPGSERGTRIRIRLPAAGRRAAEVS